MKILLTNRSLAFRAGSETWCMTMYNELIKEHEVDVFTTGPNKMLAHAGKYDEDKFYDLAIINHRECLIALRDKDNIGRRVFTCHGVLPKPEQPEAGADVYVGVSEETRDNIIRRGFPCDTIIRNPVDTERFKSLKPVNKELKNILYMSNRYDSLKLIQEATKDYTLTVIGSGNGKSDVENYINNADLVITLGRGVYESLACERNVIVYDRGKGDGFIKQDGDIFQFRENNCSGRFKKEVWTVEEMREQFKNYDPNRSLREYIMCNNNVTKIAHEYTTL